MTIMHHTPPKELNNINQIQDCRGLEEVSQVMGPWFQVKGVKHRTNPKLLGLTDLKLTKYCCLTGAGLAGN
ncbi:uncharacterized protein ANIA_11561 [Aspergillus nidulans FGSC A4]|uniref:Uncharacterized protein n=1 Tax=Emericella nidulans (strain FGSC A4 / ATCC 38163 / CBS 112.46 / NRRL 194 / M139) TaxID=227321 RepID=C8VCC0_EMENI|nr:hypothetical protein [Aspergillus nidulans FGSC A4]CBF78412.1 TPA: hypothetical protein ANIA_11561 [Aspergillus nidulans FGSC A4]